MAGWTDAAPKELADYADAVHRIAAILERGLGVEPDARIRELSVSGERTAGANALRDPPARRTPARTR